MMQLFVQSFSAAELEELLVLAHNPLIGRILTFEQETAEEIVAFYAQEHPEDLPVVYVSPEDTDVDNPR